MEKTEYSIHDSFMSGFVCMYFQDPSLLQFQKRLEDAENKSNLETLFRVRSTPELTQMKVVIDNISGDFLRPVFKEYFSRLQRGKHLEQYQKFPSIYAYSIGATQFFSSKKINCSS